MDNTTKVIGNVDHEEQKGQDRQAEKKDFIYVSHKPLFALLGKLETEKRRLEELGQNPGRIRRIDEEISACVQIFLHMGGKIAMDRGLTLFAPERSGEEGEQ
jgi:hypothetical protein